MHLHTERFLNAYQAELQDAINAFSAAIFSWRSKINEI